METEAKDAKLRRLGNYILKLSPIGQQAAKHFARDEANEDMLKADSNYAGLRELLRSGGELQRVWLGEPTERSRRRDQRTASYGAARHGLWESSVCKSPQSGGGAGLSPKSVRPHLRPARRERLHGRRGGHP
jgi:hypothetical protein